MGLGNTQSSSGMLCRGFHGADNTHASGTACHRVLAQHSRANHWQPYTGAAADSAAQQIP